MTLKILWDMSEWKEGKFNEIAEIEMGQSPSGDTCNSNGQGIPLLNGPTEFGNKKPLAVQYTIDAKRLSRTNDILFCVRGSTTGKMNWSDKTYAIGRGLAAIRHKKGEDYRYFVRGILDHNLELLLASATGSTFPNISRNQLEELEILIPPLPEQTAIASILSSLDDKIDLLHRQNATLEKMAETLFRQWFVEEAKEEWEEGKLSDLVIVKYGKDHKKLLDGNIPVYGSGGLMRSVEKSLYDKESVLIPRKGTLNNVMYQDEPFWTVDTMFYTEMKMPNVAKFVYHFVKVQDLASMNVGSAVPSMTTEILNNMPMDIPPAELFEKFEGAVAPLYKKMNLPSQ
jgi:type I restriction enzyme S subunit